MRRPQYSRQMLCSLGRTGIKHAGARARREGPSRGRCQIKAPGRCNLIDQHLTRSLATLPDNGRPIGPGKLPAAARAVAVGHHEKAVVIGDRPALIGKIPHPMRRRLCHRAIDAVAAGLGQIDPVGHARNDIEIIGRKSFGQQIRILRPGGYLGKQTAGPLDPFTDLGTGSCAAGANSPTATTKFSPFTETKSRPSI